MSMEIINLIALIVVPIAAVYIGQKLQDREQKRKDKIQIFKILMTSRIFGWTNDSVQAMNLIDVVLQMIKMFVISGKSALTKCVLPKVMTPHTLRHTFCTTLANAGMNPKALQYIMGHSNINMTLNYYAHTTSETSITEMKRLIA